MTLRQSGAPKRGATAGRESAARKRGAKAGREALLLNGLLAVVAPVAVGRRWIGASRGRSRFSDLIQVNASHPAAMRIPVWTKNAEGATRMYSVTGEMPKIWNMLAGLAAIGLLAGAMLNAAVGHIAA
jgi:hypothetical protein